MHPTLNKTVLVIKEGHRPAFPRIRPLLLGFLRSGIIILLVIVHTGPALAEESYCVQIGTYQSIKNAEKQYAALQKNDRSFPLDYLRLEKSGNFFAIRIGKYSDRAGARLLLSKIISRYPQAFIRKGDWDKRAIVRMQEPEIPSRPPEPVAVSGAPGFQSGPKTDTVPEAAGSREEEPAALLLNEKSGPTTKGKSSPLSSGFIPKANRTVLYGTILEVSSLPPLQPGFSAARDWTRLIIQVEETLEVKGYPNYLQGKEKEPVTVFSETRSPFFIPGNKVKALIEYRGNRHSRFFWIIKSDPLPR